MAILQVSNGNPDGTTVGQSASDLLAFHGSAPVDQAAVITSVTTTAAVGVSGNGVAIAYGFATGAQADAIVANVNAITALLKEKGLMATA